MKFIKELDYTFVLLIMYIAKSVLLPGVIDLGVLVLLSSIFVLKYITNRVAGVKEKLGLDQLSFDRFKILEELSAKREVLSENEFRDLVNKNLGDLNEKVANLAMTGAFKNQPLGRR